MKYINAFDFDLLNGASQMPNIPLRVRNLVKRLDSSDPIMIAKKLNITIIYGKTPEKVNGFWRRILRRKYIGVNEDITEEWEQKAVIAHELGHIFLHPGYASYCIAGRTYLSNSHKEGEADQFSAELLSFHCNVEKEYILDFLKNGWNLPKGTVLKQAVF